MAAFLELEAHSAHRARIHSIWEMIHPFAQASFAKGMAAGSDHGGLDLALGIAAVVRCEADLTGNGLVFERVVGLCESCMALASRHDFVASRKTYLAQLRVYRMR